MERRQSTEDLPIGEDGSSFNAFELNIACDNFVQSIASYLGIETSTLTQEITALREYIDSIKYVYHAQVRMINRSTTDEVQKKERELEDKQQALGHAKARLSSRLDTARTQSSSGMSDARDTLLNQYTHFFLDGAKDGHENLLDIAAFVSSQESMPQALKESAAVLQEEERYLAFYLSTSPAPAELALHLNSFFIAYGVGINEERVALHAATQSALEAELAVNQGGASEEAKQALKSAHESLLNCHKLKPIHESLSKLAHASLLNFHAQQV